MHRAADKRSSRKLDFYHCSFSETPYVGVILYVADRGCIHELPPNGVLGNSPLLYEVRLRRPILDLLLVEKPIL